MNNPILKEYRYYIFSSDPDKLVKFYTDVLGWKITNKLEYENDYGYALVLSEGGMRVWLARHSEVTGKNKDPYRHILNLYTDNITYFLEKARVYPGVVVVAEPFSMGEIVPGETRWAATLLDPENNCFQLMGQLK